MIVSSPANLILLFLAPLAIGTSLTLRGAMLLNALGRVLFCAALGLDALTIYGFIRSLRIGP